MIRRASRAFRRRRKANRLRRLAAIDIGTNTIRCSSRERGGKRTVPVARRRSIVGLGRCLRETGRIGEAEFAAGLRVLREYRREMGRGGSRRTGRAAPPACGRPKTAPTSSRRPRARGSTSR